MEHSAFWRDLEKEVYQKVKQFSVREKRLDMVLESNEGYNRTHYPKGYREYKALAREVANALC